MATIQSSTEHLTLNADGSGKDIKFQANGVEKASIDSTGALTVAGLTSTGIDDNATSTAITIDASENVGIGTTSPTSPLHIQGSGHTALTITGGTSSDAQVRFGDSDDNDIGGIHYDNAQNSMKFLTSTSERMRIDSSGSLLVNRTAAATNGQKLYVESDNFVMGVSGTNATGELVRFFGNGGSVAGTVSHSGTSVAYNTSSDYRLKELDVPMEGSIDRLKLLRPINFAWKADGSRVDGFFAHEAGEVVPECATGVKDGMIDEEYEVTPAVMDGETVVTEAVMGTRSVPDYQGIDQSKLVPLLTSALQEAVVKIEALEARVTALEV